VGWVHAIEGGHTVTFNIDISNLQLAYASVSSTAASNVTSLTTYNFSLGYGW
jgi:hypothetical protein